MRVHFVKRCFVSQWFKLTDLLREFELVNSFPIDALLMFVAIDLMVWVQNVSLWRYKNNQLVYLLRIHDGSQMIIIKSMSIWHNFE